MVKAFHAGRHRGDPRRRLQPHRRGRRRSARRCPSAGSTTGASTAGSATTRPGRRSTTPTGTSPAAATPSTPSKPFALRLILDSLRYWVTEMHVDGFRFDLMSALTRVNHRLDLDCHLLIAIGQDPVLRHVKLIAEPWDASMDGYLVGEFPPPWVEWNDQYRDEIRDFWRSALRRHPHRRHPARRLLRPVRRRRALAVRLDQLRHRARRLHGARPGHLRAQAQRGERRGQPGRHRQQPVVELRRRGRDRRPGRCSPCAGGRPPT